MILSLAQWNLFVDGAIMTIVLSFCGFLVSALFALPMASIRAFGPGYARHFIGALTAIAQGVPVPVLMFLAYFGVGEFYPSVDPMVTAVLAMSVFSCAYLTDIWRGALQSIDRTQWQAAESLGMRPLQVLVWIIAPQAVRRAIPPTTGFLVQVIKNTSYATVIGVYELTYSSRVLNNATFKPFVIFSIAAVFYFVGCYPISRLAKRLEIRFATV